MQEVDQRRPSGPGLPPPSHIQPLVGAPRPQLPSLCPEQPASGCLALHCCLEAPGEHRPQVVLCCSHLQPKEGRVCAAAWVSEESQQCPAPRFPDRWLTTLPHAAPMTFTQGKWANYKVS
ncbi:hypothetical protein H1C71_027084 [Ictidomys tridecemlineatus]|nr:hypothetical protein H1C71_027084 [Ictidomys tridecemlineatus]